MSTTLRGRVKVAPALLWLLLVAALVAVIAGGALVSGAIRLPTQDPTPLLTSDGLPAEVLPPLLASNGRMYVADGASLLTYAADGSDRQSIADLPDGATSLVVSPDGSLLAYYVRTTTGRIEIRDLGTDQVTPVPPPVGFNPGDQITWSPNGDRLVFPVFNGSVEHIGIAPTDGGPATIVGEDVIDPALGIWWPMWSPTGDMLVFVGLDRAGSESGIYLIRPDGTGLEQLPTPALGSPPGAVSWSPDPGVRRLLYTSVTGVHVYDVATGEDTIVGGGFWPTWSPDGSSLSYWSDGTVVTTIDKVLSGDRTVTRLYPPFTNTCQDHPDRATTAFCGPASWSPDGTRLYAPDIVGTSIVSFLADGSGGPVVIPLDSNVKDVWTPMAWQPIRP